MPHIRLNHVTKRFGKAVAVDDLNIEIQDGEFVTLLGPSGCGKTTTLRMIAGLETPTEGNIYIDDTCVFSADQGIDISPDKRNVGFLFQNYALWPHMTVYKNIAFGLENLKWDKERIRTRVEELLTMLKISEFHDRYPSELSGGQQQRVAIARTLATGPKILFMDEPLSNLDAKLRMEMRTELKRLHVETGSTFVYVTHDQLEAMTLSSKICLLKEGLLQQYEPPLDIYHNPSNYFVADFVGSPNINMLEMTGEQVNLDEIKLNSKYIKLLFTPVTSSITIPKEKKLYLGIRPEDIEISDDGIIEAAVYSTLPSGMETIVKLDIHGLILTCVVFGGVDFKIGNKVKIAFHAKKYVLFDVESERNIAIGMLA
ncbi:MAG: ABC transporter ATP-binding protein [Spirochaetia bacterium]|nr:ABC transporter ATP-binding protein [Spirochaetia bacterium]MCF7946849.1 ABC transporter ATP-binding protein [Spirochaetia bacterium]